MVPSQEEEVVPEVDSSQLPISPISSQEPSRALRAINSVSPPKVRGVYVSRFIRWERQTWASLRR